MITILQTVIANKATIAAIIIFSGLAIASFRFVLREGRGIIL